MQEPTSVTTVAPPSARPDRAAAGATRWPAVVCAAFVAVQLVLVVPGSGLGWDETVYTSQVSGSVPAAYFSAPRARGVTLLAAPVAQITASGQTIHVWMALLSGLGLFCALRVWRFLLPSRVLALAGALFATLWVSVYYGPQVMPNLWSAYGVLAAVGCFLRMVRDRADRGAVAGLVTGVAVTGLMRPGDAVTLVLALAVAGLVVPAWRRLALALALVTGLVLGCGEWVVEAYLHYGGPLARLHLASSIQGGTGLHLALYDQLRALDGRALCRPCTVPWQHKITAVWWFALLPLAAVGAVSAARRTDLATAAGRRSRVAVTAVPLLTATAVAVPYLFLIGYAAPRFLLPAYALLAVPVACGLWAVAADRTGRWRPVAAVALAAALGMHVAVQIAITADDAHRNRAMRRAYTAVADRLHDAGVRPPCVISGDHAVPLAYYAGCASRQIDGPDMSTTAAGLTGAARRVPVAFLVVTHKPPPGFARTWRPLPLPSSAAFSSHVAYLAPR